MTTNNPALMLLGALLCVVSIPLLGVLRLVVGSWWVYRQLDHMQKGER